jgi:hypothetical protein
MVYIKPTQTDFAVTKYAARVAIGTLVQLELATSVSTNHSISGTSTLTNRPFATDIPLPILLPPDPVYMAPCLAPIILGLCEYSDRG